MYVFQNQDCIPHDKEALYGVAGSRYGLMGLGAGLGGNGASPGSQDGTGGECATRDNSHGGSGVAMARTS